MSENFFAVPPRKVVGAEVTLPVVLTLNGLSRNVSVVGVDPISVSTSEEDRTIEVSLGETDFALRTGDTFTGNINFDFAPATGRYGLALHGQESDPVGAVGGAIYFNSTFEVLKYYTGSEWRTLDFSGATGVLSVQAGQGLLADGVPFGIITSVGALSLNYSADATWLGDHEFSGSVTFNNPVTFDTDQTFNAAKLTISGQSVGDLLYRSASAWSRLPIGSSGQVLTVAGGAPSWEDPSSSSDNLVWTKYTMTYEDLNNAPGTSYAAPFAILPAAGIIHAVKVKHSQAFAGGSNTTATISVGTLADTSRYSKAFNVFQSVSDTAMQHTMQLSAENHGSSTTVYANLVVNSNVATLTQGMCDIWLLVSQAN